MIQKKKRLVLFLPHRADPAQGVRVSADLTPLELLQIAGFPDQNGYECVIIDAMVDPDYMARLEEACDGALLFASSCILGYQVAHGAQVARAVRAKFPKLRDLAEAKTSDIEKPLSEIGLYRAKARAMKGIAQALIKEHGGKAPSTREALVALPGVGRKTANCVLCYAFKVPAIAVDTHVHRIANRLGWVRTKRVEDTEQALMRLIPKDLWLHVNRVFVQFGRNVCIPGRPRCWKCPVLRFCAYPHKNLKRPA